MTVTCEDNVYTLPALCGADVLREPGTVAIEVVDGQLRDPQTGEEIELETNTEADGLILGWGQDLDGPGAIHVVESQDIDIPRRHLLTLCRRAGLRLKDLVRSD